MLLGEVAQRGTRESGAVFSECENYRYALWREWNAEDPMLMFIGLNPSTATHEADDPTIRRCKRFAKDNGYGSLAMLNLFAFRATKPADMLSADDPIGLLTDQYLQEFHERAGRTVAAWGTHGSRYDRRDWWVSRLERIGPNAKARHLGEDFWCLGTTKDGHPRHPLYVPADQKFLRYAVIAP